ncbi:HNH nuclease [Serratia phage vB_SmaM-Kamaji]|nr:HNH nuclease [Serratia phage vB_SmaM-Kamaji]
MNKQKLAQAADVLSKHLEVFSLYRYDPLSGDLIHLPREDATFNTKFAGKVAGSVSKDTGYLMLNVLGSMYYAHRVIFAGLHGYLPIEVDHKDRNRSNNSAINLVASDRLSNSINTSGHKDAKIKHKNISRKRNSFTVEISRKGVRKTKTLKTLEEALQWRNEYLLGLGEPIPD